MSNTSSSTTLVIGATGYLGTAICSQLVAAHKKVKALVRTSSDPIKVKALQEMGVETVIGDMKDPASLRAAFEGVGAVISTASATLSQQQTDSIESVDEAGQLNVVEAAANAQVNQFIYISFNPMSQDFPLQQAKRAVEKKLIESQLNYTILQPTIFMEVWLSPALGFDYPNARATIYGDGTQLISWISLGDVAAFAVASLGHPAANRTVIELGGPEAISPHEVVSLFEESTHRSFELTHVPLEALQAQKNAAPNSLSQSFASLMIGYAEGSVIDMHDTLAQFPVRLTSVKDYVQRVTGI